MFICEDCLKKYENDKPMYLSESHGACEVCGKVADCVDIPSSKLKLKKTPADKLAEDIKKRNERLLALFISMGYDIKLIGNDNNPAVVLNDSTIVSCHVNSFDLIFHSKPFVNDKFFVYQLTERIIITPEKFNDVINCCEHRPVLHLKVVTFAKDLLLCGWNFTQKNVDSTKYPVFAMHRPVYYLNEKSATIVKERFADYNMEIVKAEVNIERKLPHA